MLKGGVDFFADCFAADVELDLAGTILHGGKARLTHDALEHHPAGDRNFDRLRYQRFAVGFVVMRVQIGGLIAWAEVIREGNALLANGFQFGAALGDELVFVLCAYFRINLFVAHDAFHRSGLGPRFK